MFGDRCAMPGSPLWPGRSFGRGSGFFIPEKRSVAHLRRHSRQRAPDITKHNGLAPRREEVQKQAKQTPCCAHLANVQHLPMSPASKPRQISGTRARGLCPNISRATSLVKNRWAEHCPCYAIAPNLRNRRRSNRHLVLGAPPAAVGGAAFGPTSSDAVSEHGHGHHLFQTESNRI
eukprot:COSAG05_NODE_1069_length_5970_cov_186.806166_2_plen_176_part_00